MVEILKILQNDLEWKIKVENSFENGGKIENSLNKFLKNSEKLKILQMNGNKQ